MKLLRSGALTPRAQCPSAILERTSIKFCLMSSALLDVFLDNVWVFLDAIAVFGLWSDFGLIMRLELVAMTSPPSTVVNTASEWV